MAITTEVGAANLALGKIGQTQRLTSLSGTTPVVLAVNDAFALARQGLLQEFRWRFATRRAVLAESEATARAEWGYVYELPEDFLEAQFINAGARDDQVPRDNRLSFTLEFEPAAGDLPDRQVFLTDVAPATDEAPELIYTWDQDDVAQWPPHFLEAFAWRLAGELAVPLAVKVDRAQLAFSMADQRLREAIAKEQRGRQADPPQDSEFITGRG
jgi:hypothetical protein